MANFIASAVTEGGDVLGVYRNPSDNTLTITYVNALQDEEGLEIYQADLDALITMLQNASLALPIPDEEGGA